MFLYHLPGIWRNRHGLACVLRHPGKLPLVSAMAMYISVLFVVAPIVLFIFIGINAAIHAGDPPKYYCRDYPANQQPEFGCQQGGTTPNIPPR